MKKLVLIWFTLYTSSTFAQINKYRFIKIEGGATLDNKYTFVEKGYDSKTNNLFHLGATYNFNFHNRFEIGLGPRIDYIGSADYFTKDYVLTSLLVQGQFNFSETPKSLYLYSQFGMGPKIGSFSYQGSIFEIGLGWKYHPKFLGNKRLGFSAGYNETNLQNVNTTYDVGSLTETKFERRYMFFKLKSFAVNLNYSF